MRWLGGLLVCVAAPGACHAAPVVVELRGPGPNVVFNAGTEVDGGVDELSSGGAGANVGGAGGRLDSGGGNAGGSATGSSGSGAGEPVCGDGNSTGTEALAGGCDDHDLDSGDGCSDQCVVEAGWSCKGEPSQCEKTCGDGVIDDRETCDDNNSRATDGCVACAVAAGWNCNDEEPTVCTNIDECAERSDNCDGNATCNDTDGSFVCECNDRYMGDGVTCDPADECTLGTDNCSPDALCEPTETSFTCTCKFGFAGDGVYCEKVITEVLAANTHSCAVLGGGDLRCWGEGRSGKLGYGNDADVGGYDTPAQKGDVVVTGNVAHVEAGPNSTCVLLDTGGVRCWGSATSGLLGYLGGADLKSPSTENVKVVNDDEDATVIQVSVGSVHACALLDTRKVRCWGSGVNGELGYGNEENVGETQTPAEAGDVNVGGSVTQISAGGGFTCALLATGTVRCWGLADDGRLGYGNALDIGDNESPASAGDLDIIDGIDGVDGKVLQISSGYRHTCALLNTGKVRCWGWGYEDQLGYGDPENFVVGDDDTPAMAGDVMIGDDAKVTQVSAGSQHTCVLLETGSVRCWGDGNFGKLGYGNPDSVPVPSAVGNVQVVDPDTEPGVKVTQISAGGAHTCALLSTGQVRCWGYSEYGQLGYGSARTTDVGDNEHPSSAGNVPVF